MPDFFAERLTAFTEDLASHPDAVRVLLVEMERLAAGRLLAAADSAWTPEKLTAWCESIEVGAWKELAHRWHQDRLSFAEAEIVVRDVAEELDTVREAIAMGLDPQVIRFLKRAENQLTYLAVTRSQPEH
jgi:hypothetical protein